MKTIRELVLIASVCLACLGFTPLFEDFLIIMDLSGSMGTAQQIEPAIQALKAAMDEVQTPGARYGMRVYGTGCCNPDTKLEIPISSEGREQIKKILPELFGHATSPMAEALHAARLNELANSDTFRQTVFIISDGEVDYPPACKEAALLRANGVRVVILGLEYAGSQGAQTLRQIAESPDCAAGTYIRVERPDLLTQYLISAVTAAFGLLYRIIAVVLGSIAAYLLTKFFEYYMARVFKRNLRFVPPICKALLAVMVLSLIAIFLLSPSLGVLTGILIAIALFLCSVYLAFNLVKG